VANIRQRLAQGLDRMIVGIGHRHEIGGKIVPHVRLEIALRKLVQHVGKCRQRLRLLLLDPGPLSRSACRILC
jgi:hypothetical protein